MKKLKYLFFLIASFLIGMLISFLYDHGLLQKLGDGFNDVAWYFYLILLIVVFYVTLAVHELTHLIVFLVHKIKGKAIYLTAFLFVKKDNKWRFKFNPKMFLLMGGLVIPDLGKIENDEEYDHAVKAFARSLIAAPLASIIFGVLFLISFLLIWVLTNNFILIGLMAISTIYVIIITIFYVIASSVKTKDIYGDFPAYKMMKTDKHFQFVQIVQYLSFSSNLTNDTEEYIFNKTVEVLKRENNYYSQFNLMLLNHYLEDVIFANKKPDENITAKILGLNDYRLIKNNDGVVIFCYKMYFIYTHIDHEQAIDIFNKNKASFKDEPIYNYYLHKTMYLLNISDETEYLSNNENVATDKLGFIFEPILDYEDEKKTNIRLTPKIIVKNEEEVNNSEE